MEDTERAVVARMLEQHEQHVMSLNAVIETLLAERSTAWDKDVRAVLAARVTDVDLDAEGLQRTVTFATWAADKLEEGRQERAKKRAEERQKENDEARAAMLAAVGPDPLDVQNGAKQ